jgi:ribosomal protein L11 methyltransferase
MGWIEVHIDTAAQHADTLCEQMTAHGAQALTFKDAGNQPIYEPAFDVTAALWPETTITGLFADDEDFGALTLFLEQEKAAGRLQEFSLKALADEDWERRCLASFEPMRFGKRLWVCPSWHTVPDTNAITVILDPGLAFGTGTHETTALCLEWLDYNGCAGQTVIDYGCGSGILAIAAAKLGAAQVYAVDYDPKALTATGENAQRNGLNTALFTLSAAADFAIQAPADILLANILAAPLIDLAPKLAKMLKSGGKIILSGILIEQSANIFTIYSNYFDMQPIDSKGEWVRLCGIKR